MKSDDSLGLSTPIAIIGGTGNLGYGIALRLAAAGHRVAIGSRDEAKSQQAASSILKTIPSAQVQGFGSHAAASVGEVVFITVPFSAQFETLTSLRSQLVGKIVVDTTVPLVPPKVRTVQMPLQGSAAAIAQGILGVEVRLVSAFQNISAGHLRNLEHEIDCDVLVTGDDTAARQIIVELAGQMGLRGVHAGPLANAAAAEALTSVLLFVNKHYGSRGAGLKLTDVTNAVI